MYEYNIRNKEWSLVENKCINNYCYCFCSFDFYGKGYVLMNLLGMVLGYDIYFIVYCYYKYQWK